MPAWLVLGLGTVLFKLSHFVDLSEALWGGCGYGYVEGHIRFHHCFSVLLHAPSGKKGRGKRMRGKAKKPKACPVSQP